MIRKAFSLPPNWVMATLVAIVLVGIASATGPERAIHRFQGGGDGAWPGGGLIADAVGDLYGTTMLGGGSFGCGKIRQKPIGCGTVFELTPTNSGRTWTETVLYAFQGGSDGEEPEGSLVFDSAGNLYGTTSAYGYIGKGTMFQLSPPAQQGGAWSETVIYRFSGYNDGFFPVGLIIDQQGNLYGEEPGYPEGSYGDVFELSPPPVQGGTWTYNVLYTFKGGADGNEPLGGLIIDRSGNLYGTTATGGAGSRGTVFELKHPIGKAKAWAERVLYAFTGQTDGGGPVGGVAVDKKRNLFGTTSYGGQSGDGTVFELSPTGRGGWTETVLHSFDRNNEGYIPEARVVLDKWGNIFSTTFFSDAFELSPPIQEGGPWTETILYNFTDPNPSSLLLSKWEGTVYGTTAGSGYGRGEHGTVFKIFVH
jgi:uncharacterized repeat protein (TIGR03803 family)